MVAERVGSGRGAAQRAEAVPAVKVGPGQPARHHRCLPRVEQACPEQVAEVGGDAVDGALGCVEREGRQRSAAVPDPECRAEAGPQRRGPRPQLGCTVRVGVARAEGHEQGRAGKRRLVGVGLRLAERDGRRGDAPVGPLDPIARVLPALVGEPVSPGVDVLEETVAVGVGGTGQPGERRAKRIQELADEILVQAPAPGVVQGAHPERRGVDRAVVARREPDPGVLLAELVDDLAWCLARPLVEPRALVSGEGAQRAVRELGAERKQQARRPERVPAEERQVPRATSPEEDVRLTLLFWLTFGESEPSQIRQAAVDQPAQLAVARSHPGRRPLGARRPEAPEVRGGAHVDGRGPALPRRHLHLPFQRRVAGRGQRAGRRGLTGDRHGRRTELPADARGLRPRSQGL